MKQKKEKVSFGFPIGLVIGLIAIGLSTGILLAGMFGVTPMQSQLQECQEQRMPSEIVNEKAQAICNMVMKGTIPEFVNGILKCYSYDARGIKTTFMISDLKIIKPSYSRECVKWGECNSQKSNCIQCLCYKGEPCAAEAEQDENCFSFFNADTEVGTTVCEEEQKEVVEEKNE